MNFTCTLPKAPALEVVCTLPDANASSLTPAIIVASIAAFAAICSAAAAAVSARAARRGAKREDARDERAKQLVLRGLYEFVTTGEVRQARNTLMDKRYRIKIGLDKVETIHEEYFTIIWAIELIYRTLIANNITVEEATPVLAYHVQQLQAHIDVIHRAQDEEPEGGDLDNSIARPDYATQCQDWDARYPHLRVAQRASKETPPAS